jgi:surface protein
MPALMGADSGTFTTKAELQYAVQAYYRNPDAATQTYGSIAGWDVSMITDMSHLFSGLTNFNADISSWDTSKVTDMNQMFWVRSARALAPDSLESGLPRTCRLRRRRPTPALAPGPHLAPHRMPLPSTRQSGSAFNQPLSFDTSKVTDMNRMFVVRSARALAPTSLESGLPPCMPLAPPPPHALPPPGPHLAPHRMPLPSTRQLAKAFNQPLSLDTSKVTDMRYMFYVRSARALAPNSLESGLPRACRLRRRRPTPSRLPARTSPRIACVPPFDSAGSVGVQPAAEP